MSRSLNKVMLIGNVGSTPSLKQTPSGAPVTSFRMATSNTRKDREGNLVEITDWHTVVAWRNLAQIITNIVTKGSRIYIEGKLQSREIEDANGYRKEIVEIVADQFLILDSKERRKYQMEQKIKVEENKVVENYEYEYVEDNSPSDYDSEYGDGYSSSDSKKSPF
jgi:single-strand DNA-binding protein